MKKYVLNIPDAISDRIEKAHKKGKFSASLPSQFIKHLVTMGLEEYEAQEKYRDAQLETRLQAAGCKATPESSPLQARIIPFPGAPLPDNSPANKDKFQNDLEGFLREIGYIE